MGEPTSLVATRTKAHFTALYEAVRGPLTGFVRGMVGNDEEAAQIAQEVFLHAWALVLGAGPPFDGQSEEKAIRRWLFCVAYYKTASFVRRRKTITWEPFDPFNPPESAPFQGRTRVETQVADLDLLDEALAGLKPEDRALVLLKDAHGYTIAEIVQIFAAAGIPLTLEAAKKRFARAKKDVQEYCVHDAERGKQASP